MKVLATDLDGTLLPLAGQSRNRDDLRLLSNLLDSEKMVLVFVTGRHIESVVDVVATAELPLADYIFANVGTELYRKVDVTESNSAVRMEHVCDSGCGYQLVEDYRWCLDAITGNVPAGTLREGLSEISGLRVQEEAKQGHHKLSYYCDASQIEDCVIQIERRLGLSNQNFEIVSSVDPFTGDGLIDLLPSKVNKSFAVEWWSKEQAFDQEQIIYAGDSGNDLHALISGFNAVVVGNAADDLKKVVTEQHLKEFSGTQRLHISELPATSGVLDGVRHFLNKSKAS